MTKEERQTKFEIIWADNHSVPVETMAQYRFEDRDSYRMPDMASHYRTFCAAVEVFESELPMIMIPCGAEAVAVKVRRGMNGDSRMMSVCANAWTHLVTP